MQNTERQDLYTRITGQIVASLEQGVRPWTRPWSGENAATRITRPLRHNGTPYSGINILVLWLASVEHGFSSPSWMTFKQALDLNAHVRKDDLPLSYWHVQVASGRPENERLRNGLKGTGNCRVQG